MQGLFSEEIWRDLLIFCPNNPIEICKSFIFQLKIRDVHLRYEDDTLNPACPFSFGVVIKELSAQSTDGEWVRFTFTFYWY